MDLSKNKKIEKLKIKTIEYSCDKLITNLNFKKGLEIESIEAKLKKI